MAKWASICPDCGATHAQKHGLGCPRVSISYGGYPVPTNDLLCPACGHLGRHSNDCSLGLATKSIAPTTEGRKDDGGKARHDLIPPELPEAIAAVLTFGASKYGERNWEKGMSWGRPYAALMRHMLAWWRGEKVDTETGMSHLWHAGCCIAFLIAFEQRQKGIDDRP